MKVSLARSRDSSRNSRSSYSNNYNSSYGFEWQRRPSRCCSPTANTNAVGCVLACKESAHAKDVIDGYSNSGHAKTPLLSPFPALGSLAERALLPPQRNSKEDAVVRANGLVSLPATKRKKSDTSHSILYHQRSHDDGKRSNLGLNTSRNYSGGGVVSSAPFKAKILPFPHAKMSTQLFALVVSLMISIHIHGTVEATPTNRGHRHGKLNDAMDMQESEYPMIPPSTSRDMMDGLDKETKLFLKPEDIVEEIHQDAVNRVPAYLDVNLNPPRDEEGTVYDGMENSDAGDYQEQKRFENISTSTTDQYDYSK